MTPRRILFLLLQIAGTLQIVVGIAMWTGHWYSFLGVHMMNGILFVLILWAIAIMALVKRQRTGVAVFALLWGVVVVAVGVTQQRILPGDLHWIVRVLHLAIGLAAMPLAAMLSVGLERERKPA